MEIDSPLPGTEPPRDCPRCPRLVALRRACRAEHPDWWNAPVHAFGDPDAWLALAALPKVRVIVALGRIAHDAVLRAAGVRLAAFPFAHGAVHALPDGRHLVDSYHCSRYNTNTGRLTSEMFADVFRRALALHEESA